jgi:hypothetical protein
LKFAIQRLGIAFTVVSPAFGRLSLPARKPPEGGTLNFPVYSIRNCSGAFKKKQRQKKGRVAAATLTFLLSFQTVLKTVLLAIGLRQFAHQQGARSELKTAAYFFSPSATAR